MMQGNRVAVAVNPKLLERALDLRKMKFGVEYQHFKKINVSVWEVKVNGQTQIFDAGNVPITDLNKIHGKGATDVGLHSEAFIAEHLRHSKPKATRLRSCRSTPKDRHVRTVRNCFANTVNRRCSIA